MWKALLKKQFAELKTLYLRNLKPGQRRGKGSTALFLLLLALVFVSLGAAFYAAASALGGALVPAGRGAVPYAGAVRACFGLT